MKLDKREEEDNDEEETVSLVTMGGSSTSIKTVASSKWRQFISILLGGCVVLFLLDSMELDSTTGEVEQKIHPLADARMMLEKLQQARENWVENTMKQDYGSFYEDVFEPLDEKGQRVNIGRQRAFVDPNRLPRNGEEYDSVRNKEGPAWDRMVRKWMIKILQVQLGMLQDTSTEEDSSNKTYSQFVWVNGGHSASAGHGNFFRESYSAVLERDLQPILQQIGLDFQVRNYAMGGTSSAEEVALCFNSIFGRDVDSITWDYGMTDAGSDHKIILYAYNAARVALLSDSLSQPGNIRHRPSLWALHLFSGMEPILQSIQKMGMTTLALDTRFRKDIVYEALPDMFGKTDAEIAVLPPFIQYFKCQNRVEEGDPGCADKKFNMTFCPLRHGRNTWHPGWRLHALTGRMMSLTVLEIITDALKTLIPFEPTTEEETADQKQERLMALLQKLDAEEQRDYDSMFQKPLPEELRHYFDETLWKGDHRDENKESMKDLPMVDTMIRNFFFCHTAMLPAEIRFRGLLTENSTAIGTIIDDKYEHAIFQSKIKEAENLPDNEAVVYSNPNPGRGEQMVLGATDSDYEVCEDTTRHDHKDFFWVSSQEGWRTLTIPNDAEKNYYTEFNADSSKGWIFVCMVACDWGNCDEGDVQKSVSDGTFDAGELGKLEMEINGVSVVDAKCITMCCALRHAGADGSPQFEWIPNERGMYDIRTRITGASKYAFARFSSFILA